MVTLPPEPIYADSPPAICATCDTEVPDYRRESFACPPTLPTSAPASSISPTPTPLTTNLQMDRKLSRGNLFRSLGGLLAERAEDAVETAKSRFTEDLPD